jgi:hypothetical protein
MLLDGHWFTSALQGLTFFVVGHGALPVYCYVFTTASSPLPQLLFLN